MGTIQQGDTSPQVAETTLKTAEIQVERKRFNLMLRENARGTRLVAYEAAFFTLPDKDLFTSLVARALREEDQDIQEVAASWLATRFPVEGEAQISGSVY